MRELGIMQSSDIEKKNELKLQLNKTITFPDGLPAFEKVKEFIILSNEDEAPFLWLQACNKPNLAFICIDPFLVHPNYRPEINDDDVEFLKLAKEEDAFILSIVNIRNNSNDGVTCNLVGPVVINWKERIGKQVIIKNHLNYTVRHQIEPKD
jgi:flagellar assembly factor FliW